jgi:hypothetical protein
MRVCATLCVTFLFLALALPTFASIELLRNIPDVGDPNKSPQWYLIAIVGLSALSILLLAAWRLGSLLYSSMTKASDSAITLANQIVERIDVKADNLISFQRDEISSLRQEVKNRNSTITKLMHALSEARVLNARLVTELRFYRSGEITHGDGDTQDTAVVELLDDPPIQKDSPGDG